MTAVIFASIVTLISFLCVSQVLGTFSAKCLHEDNLVKVVFAFDGSMKETSFNASLKRAVDFVEMLRDEMESLEKSAEFRWSTSGRKSWPSAQRSGSSGGSGASTAELWASQMKNYKHDIVFLLDGSNSTGLTSFKKGLAVIGNFTKQLEFGIDKSRISVIQYSSVGIFTELSFGDSVSQNLVWIQDKIASIPFRGGAKNTSGGLMEMKRHFQWNVRPMGHNENVVRTGIVLTDGKEEEVPPQLAQDVDIAFLFDVTGSMGGQLESVKRDAIRMVTDIKRTYADSLVRVGFVGYRDFGDVPQFVTFDFSRDFAKFKSWLGSVGAAGGGDTPENVRGGIDKIFPLNWRANLTRVLVGIADAEGHGDWDSRESTARIIARSQLTRLKCETRIVKFLFLSTPYPSTSLKSMLRAFEEESRYDCQGSLATNSRWFKKSSVNSANIVNEIVNFTKIAIKTASFRNISLQLRETGVDVVGVGLSPDADDDKLRDIVGEGVVGKGDKVIVVGKDDDLDDVVKVVEEAIVDDIDFCATRPCHNNGTCVNKKNTFHCDCHQGFHGIFCEFSPSVQFAAILHGDDDVNIVVDFNSSDVEALKSLRHPGFEWANLKGALKITEERFKREKKNVDETKDPIDIIVVFTEGNFSAPDAAVAAYAAAADASDAAVAAADKLRDDGVDVIIYYYDLKSWENWHEMVKVAGGVENIFMDTIAFPTDYLMSPVCRRLRQTNLECHVDSNGRIHFRVFATEHFKRTHLPYIGSCPVSPLPSPWRPFEYFYDARVDECGAAQRESSGKSAFNNSFTPNAVEKGSTQITRDTFPGWDMTCFFDRNHKVSSSFVPILPKNKNGTHEILPEVSIEAHLTPDFDLLVKPPVYLKMDQRVYYRVWTNLKRRIFLTNCWTTPEKEAAAGAEAGVAASTTAKERRYYLLKNGCGVDATYDGRSGPDVNETRFSFSAFRFLHPHRLVYVYCEATLCSLSSNDSRCDRGCQPESPVESPSGEVKHLSYAGLVAPPPEPQAPPIGENAVSGPFLLSGENCEGIDVIPNGVVLCTDATRVGSVCRVECRSGFRSSPAASPASAASPDVGEVVCVATKESNVWIGELEECRDVDECVENGVDPCLEEGVTVASHRCENTPGSYVCVCREGFKRIFESEDCRPFDRFEGSVRFPKQKFTGDFLVKDSALYRSTKATTEIELANIFGGVGGDVGGGVGGGVGGVVVSVTAFRPGSVVAHFDLYQERKKGASGLGATRLRRSAQDRILATKGTILGIGLGEGDLVLEDVNECGRDVVRNECHQSAECIDTKGSFECRCRQGFRDDSPLGLEGRLCVEENDETILEATVGIIVAFLVVVVVGKLVHYGLKKRRKDSKENSKMAEIEREENRF